MAPDTNSTRSSLGFAPGGAIRGSLTVPGSKSIAQRALLLSAVRDGETTLTGFTVGDDVRGALEVSRAFGAEIERRPSGVVLVRGRAPGERAFPIGRAPLDAGESGTLARFATALLGLCDRAGAQGVVQVRGSLRARTSIPLFEALRRAGVKVADPSEGRWPATVKAGETPDELSLVRPVSSQEVSALLAALAAQSGRRRLKVLGEIPSRPYVDLTLAVLASFGARISEQGHGSQRTEFTVEGPLRRGAFAFQIEPDASAAAVGLAAACLSGGEAELRGLPENTAQGDVRIAEYLNRFGCRAHFEAGRLGASGFPVRGAAIDLVGEPDLAPVLAVIAAGAAVRGEGSGLSGLGALVNKESDRIAVLREGLTRAGFSPRADANRLVIPAGFQQPAEPVELDPAGDHRMAFAFGLLGLFVEGIRVRNPRCVSKSWPEFWEAMQELGAQLT